MGCNFACRIVCRPSPYDSAVESADAPNSRNRSRLATRPSDDDEAFALARIPPFQLGCRGTAAARATVLMVKEARPGSWWHRGEGAPPPSCLGVSGSRGPLTSGSSRLPGAARAGRHLRIAGLRLVAAGLSTPSERRAPRPQVGGSDHHHAYSHPYHNASPTRNLVIISYSNDMCARWLWMGRYGGRWWELRPDMH
eukprot:SAG25_NODE_95_length_15927_cov_8.666224_6_plen_196_part_00